MSSTRVGSPSTHERSDPSICPGRRCSELVPVVGQVGERISGSSRLWYQKILDAAAAWHQRRLRSGKWAASRCPGLLGGT